MRLNRPAIEMPRIIEVKSKALDLINNTIKKLNLQGNVFLIADPNTIEIAGNKIIEILSKKRKIEYYLINTASLTECNKVIDEINDLKPNFILGVGGGSVIDVAKYSSFKSKIPFISIPTVASHDGIASSRASLLVDKKKQSLEARSPLAVIADLDIISKAPKRFMISGSADILSNITAILDWELSNRITGEHISQYAIALSHMSAKTIIEESDLIPKNIVEGAYTVLKGLITSSIAMCIAGSSRPASGAEHMISHVLDEILEKPGLHGEQCGLGSIISMYFHGGDWKLLKDTLYRLGAPTKASDLNIKKNELVYAISNAYKVKKDRYTILSTKISPTAIEYALSKTGIID